MNFYQGFHIRQVRNQPDHSLVSSRTVLWIGSTSRVTFRATTLRGLKNRIDTYYAERRAS